MILRGLLIAASGFLFIFSPGLPMSLLVRRSPSFNRDIVYWGIGAWLVALLPSLFLQSLLRQILQNSQTPRGLSGQPMDYALTLAGALLTAFFVAGGMYLVLRFKRIEATTLPPNGLALGFGVGLIAQVFTGLSLVGAGFRLMFGDASTETLVSLAQVSYLNLLLALLALILFRPALLAVSAARGVLVARALQERAVFFWLGVLVDAVFVWIILALQRRRRSPLRCNHGLLPDPNRSLTRQRHRLNCRVAQGADDLADLCRVRDQVIGPQQAGCRDLVLPCLAHRRHSLSPRCRSVEQLLGGHSHRLLDRRRPPSVDPARHRRLDLTLSLRKRRHVPRLLLTRHLERLTLPLDDRVERRGDLALERHHRL